MIEFMFDTARSIVDLVLSGAADRYPNLKIIVPHAGGVLPLLADRVERFRSIGGEPGDRRTVKAVLAQLYYDLAKLSRKAGSQCAPKTRRSSS